MPKFKVLLTDYAWNDLNIERKMLEQVDAQLIASRQTDAASLASLAADVDAIMTTWAQVTQTVIAVSLKCRIVARLGIGLDNIDVAECTRRGILVTNVPDYCQTKVAEHALALLTSMARRVAYYHHQTKNGYYDLQAYPLPLRIEGQTLGIVGFGKIGQKLAEKALGIGLKIIAVNRSPKQAVTGVEFCSLEQLLERADFVSLHLPLTSETEQIIDAKQIALMKPSAYLINTSRGGLIDHVALAEALSQNRLAGAALDVQNPEPPDLSAPPFNDPRVIVTPHSAFLSKESLVDLRGSANCGLPERRHSE